MTSQTMDKDDAVSRFCQQDVPVYRAVDCSVSLNVGPVRVMYDAEPFGLGGVVWSQDPAYAEEVADRIGIIHKGRLIELGTMAELRDRHEGKGDRLEEIFLEMVEAETA